MSDGTEDFLKFIMWLVLRRFKQNGVEGACGPHADEATGEW